MVFGVAAPAIDVFVEAAVVAAFQIGDDEARSGPLLAPGDDPLDAAPALGAVIQETADRARMIISARDSPRLVYLEIEKNL